MRVGWECADLRLRDAGRETGNVIEPEKGHEVDVDADLPVVERYHAPLKQQRVERDEKG